MHNVPPPHNFWFSIHLDSLGSNRLTGERSSHKDLQRITSQLPMRCKGEVLLGELGSLHWEDTNGKNGWGSPTWMKKDGWKARGL